MSSDAAQRQRQRGEATVGVRSRCATFATYVPRILRHKIPGTPTHEQLLAMFDTCDRHIRSVASSEKVVLIDLGSEVTGHSEYFTDHVHTTPKGSLAIAQHDAILLKPILEDVQQHRRE
jgi:hypothetical protein